MVTQIKEYNSAQGNARSPNKELSETKSVLGEYLRRLDGNKNLAENQEKVLAKLSQAGAKNPQPKTRAK